MRRIITPLLALMATAVGAAGADTALPANWPNLAKPPSAADGAIITGQSWAAARDTLSAALAKNYRSGLGGNPGSTGNATYRAWLQEWQWCELLARDTKAEALRFLGPRLQRLPNGLFSVTVTPNPKAEPTAAVALAEQAANDPNFSRVLNSVFPAGSTIPAGQILADLLPDEAKLAWTADPTFLRTLLEVLSPDDYTPQVLKNLVAIYQNGPKKFHDYLALAVALAVVYDVRTPSSWPHGQVAPGLVPKKDETPTARFNFWVKSNEAHVLVTDLRQLPAEQLKFVVDAPLDDAELIWAQENAPHGRAEFHRTFGDIAYDTHRLVNNQLDWANNRYTLLNILKVGGICVDQAYFASICGKAVGLPTLFFHGQTKDGGHAWFGYLKDTDKWAMDCGRSANMGIITGTALDPQTWNSITDHELAYLTSAFHKQPAYAAARGELAMAALFEMQGDLPRAAKALDSAIAVCPADVEAWEAKTDYLARHGAAAPALRAHYEAAVRQFTKVADVKVAFQMALVELARKTGDQTTATRLLSQINSENQVSRADLALQAEAEKISALIQAGNMAGAAREFQNQAPALGRSAGGDLFYKLAGGLAQRLYYSGDQANAKKILETTRNTLKPTRGEILDVDLAIVEKRISTPPPKTSG